MKIRIPCTKYALVITTKRKPTVPDWIALGIAGLAVFFSGIGPRIGISWPAEGKVLLVILAVLAMSVAMMMPDEATTASKGQDS